MIKYVKGDVSIRDSLKKSESKLTGVIYDPMNINYNPDLSFCLGPVNDLTMSVINLSIFKCHKALLISVYNPRHM
jgi:hypothetical protein